MPYRATCRRGAMALAMLFFTAGAAFAQGVSPLAVSVDRTRISLRDTVRLSISTTSEGGARAGNLVSPSLAEWQIVGQFERTSFDGVSGRQIRSIQLTLRPLKAGEIVIGAFVLQLGNTEVRSEPIKVTVGNGAPDPGAASGSVHEAAPDTSSFLRWEVDTDTLWLGQQLEVQLALYYNRNLRLVQASPPDINIEGFWTHDRRTQSSRRVVQIGDEVFVREVIAHQQLVPIRAGALVLPEVPIEMTLREVRGLRRDRRVVKRSAEAVPLTVKALPTAGQPPNFAGPAVGRVVLEAATDRQRIKAPDGVQLTVTTRAEGLLQNVPAVQLPDLDAFRVFPPSDSERTGMDNNGQLVGVRQQTWLLRPNTNGELVIPALSLPYFDPQSGKYAMARSRPINLRASGFTEKSAGGVAIEAHPAGGAEPLALRDVRPVSSVGTRDRPPYTSTWFFAILLGAPGLFLLLVMRDRVQDRRSQTAGSRAARRAAGVARTILDRVAKAGGDDAYARIARALMGYLEARCGVALRGLTHGDLRRALVERGVGEATAASLVAELEHCDFARFASSAGAGAVGESVARAKQIIDEVEGALR